MEDEVTNNRVESCPYCGWEKPRVNIMEDTGGNVFYVYCPHCNMRGPWGHSRNGSTQAGEAMAIERWNRMARVPGGVAQFEI